MEPPYFVSGGTTGSIKTVPKAPDTKALETVLDTTSTVKAVTVTA